MMDAQALDHLGWLTFDGVMPVRPSLLGEVVYNEHWQALMRKPLDNHPDFYPETPNAMLADILRVLPYDLGPREATVATSFVIWLGTSCGKAFLLDGKEKAARLRSSLETGFAVAWCLENARVIGRCYGYRMIEHLLAPADHWSQRVLSWGGGRLVQAPQLTTVDHEVCELMAIWLGSELGQAFVTEAEREIDLRKYARPPAAPAIAREITA